MLGYGQGLLCASLTELTAERYMRDIIAYAWATHLGVNDTRETHASVCFAALADIIGRLVDVADAIRTSTGADWTLDPDGVALDYVPPSAPVAAVCFLPRDVQLAPCPQDGTPHVRGETRGSIWPALDPLARAWCQDADLDPGEVCRIL